MIDLSNSYKNDTEFCAEYKNCYLQGGSCEKERKNERNKQAKTRKICRVNEIADDRTTWDDQQLVS